MDTALGVRRALVRQFHHGMARVTRPEEPTEALPIRAVPLPAAPVDPDRTQALHATDSTAHLAPTDSTVHLDPADRPCTLGASDSTVHLGATDSTARLCAADATVHLDPGDATVRPGADASAHPAGTTSAYPGTGPTSVYPAAGRPRRTPGAAGDAGGDRPSAAPGGEVRFGPGVRRRPPPPGPPRAAPAAAGVAACRLGAVHPARRRAAAWRSASTCGSGSARWRSSSVTVAVPQPAGDRCDVTVDVVATVRDQRPGRGDPLPVVPHRTPRPAPAHRAGRPRASAPSMLTLQVDVQRSGRDERDGHRQHHRTGADAGRHPRQLPLPRR